MAPALIVRSAAKAIGFYTAAFGAEERMRMASPDGRHIMHAELTIGNSMIFLSDEMPDMGCPSPESLGSTAAMLHLKVDDVDAALQRAIAAGANVRMPVADMFWGDRYGKVVDSFGHEWGLATRKEDLTQDQIRQRAAIFLAAWRNSEPSPLPNGERRRRGQEKANSLQQPPPLDFPLRAAYPHVP